MKTTTKKPTKNDDLLAALRAKHPTTRKEAEESDDDDGETEDEEAEDDEDEAPVSKVAKAKAKQVVTASDDDEDETPPQPASNKKQSNNTMKTKNKPETSTTALAKSKAPSSSAITIPSDVAKIRAIIAGNVSHEEIVAEAIKDALRGIGAFHKWTPNAKTRFRVVPLPVKGMLPLAVTWSHFDEEAKRSTLCAKKMAGLDCDQCDAGDRPKRTAWAIGYVYDGAGKGAKPIYEPKILTFRGQAYTGMFDAWSEDNSLFDIDEGVDGTYSIEGSGLTSKHGVTMSRAQTPAFPDDEVMAEFYAKVPLDEYMRAITFTQKAEEIADEDDDEDAEYADA